MTNIHTFCKRDVFNRKSRKKLLNSFIIELDDLKIQLDSVDLNENVPKKMKEKFKIIELKTSILRLDQSEARLVQQIFIAISCGFIGSILTLILQYYFKN